MKTVITQEINGYTIIIGFGNPVIDPVETAKIIKPMLEDSNELKAVKQKIKEVGARQRMAIQAMKESARLKIRGDQKFKEKEAEAAAHFQIVKELQEEAKPLKGPLKQKRIELIKENAIYFEPKQNEMIIDNDQHAELKTKELGEFGRLCLDGSVVYDYTKETGYSKIGDGWVINTFPFGAQISTEVILERDLTEEQKEEIAEQNEKDRVAGLSAAGKEAEKLSAINSAASQAANMRNVLEIQSDPEALTKAQDFYNSEVEKINTKYA